MTAPPERLCYVYTCFHDATYGAGEPWAVSAWARAREARWRGSRLEVAHVGLQALKVAAVMAGAGPLSPAAYIASQHDLWWVAERSSGEDWGAPPGTDEAELLQVIVVHVSADPGRSAIGGRVVEDGARRVLRFEAPPHLLAEVDDLCWFQGNRVGPLAAFLVQASKLQHHRLLRDQLRHAASGPRPLQANVLEPLHTYAATLLDRAQRIERAQRARATAGLGDRRGAARLIEELATVRTEEANDALYSALIAADRNLRVLSEERRGASTLVHNLDRLSGALAGRLPDGLLPDDREGAVAVQFEFEVAHEAVGEALASVARGQEWVGKLLAEREQELAEERTKATEFQTAVLAAVGLLVASVQAGGVFKALAGVIGASGLLLALFMNGRDGLGLRHRAAVAILTGAAATTIAGMTYFHGQHATALAGLGVAGAAVGWLAAGARAQWFEPRGSAAPTRAAVAVAVVAVTGVVVDWLAFGGRRHADAVAGWGLGIAAFAVLGVEGLVLLARGRAPGTAQ